MQNTSIIQKGGMVKDSEVEKAIFFRFIYRHFSHLNSQEEGEDYEETFNGFCGTFSSC